MELEPLFSSTRWQILEILSEKRHSPLEISIRLKTTLANVSQQLRLLGMAGLISSEKISQREKGKPRLLYSIKDNFGYIVLLTPGSAKKRLLSLSDFQKFNIATWTSAPAEMHVPLAQFFPKIEGSFREISAIILNKKFDELTIVSDSKELKKLEGHQVAAKCTVKVVEESKMRISENSVFLHKRIEVNQ